MRDENLEGQDSNVGFVPLFLGESLLSPSSWETASPSLHPNPLCSRHKKEALSTPSRIPRQVSQMVTEHIERPLRLIYYL